MEVVDRSQIVANGTEGDVTLHTVIQQDVSQIKEDNYHEAERSNGFTDGRTMRKVASIPQVAMLQAIQMGYQLDAEHPLILEIELKRYMKDHGIAAGYQTVRNILTHGGNSGIIVK